MFGTPRSTITADDIFNKVSEAYLLNYYLGINTIPIRINSPLRNDKKPSFGLYSYDGVKVYYRDFATGEHGSSLNLLSRLWKCSYIETLEKIAKDLNIYEYTKPASTPPPTIPQHTLCHRQSYNSTDNIKVNTDKIELQCAVREWLPHDICYWESYGITLKWLKRARVYPISHKIIIKNGNKMIFGADKHAYTFIEKKDGKITMKIYQPFNKLGFKWQNSHDKSVLGLWQIMPKKGDKVVICSSVKDALCLMSNTNIPCICTQGEGYPISNSAINVLKKRFTNIYVCYDNDPPGLYNSEKLCKDIKAINLVIPSFEGGKDISDYYKIKGKESFLLLFKELLSAHNN